MPREPAAAGFSGQAPKVPARARARPARRAAVDRVCDHVVVLPQRGQRFDQKDPCLFDLKYVKILSLARRRECTIHRVPHVGGAFPSSRQRQNFLWWILSCGPRAAGDFGPGGAKSISGDSSPLGTRTRTHTPPGVCSGSLKLEPVRGASPEEAPVPSAGRSLARLQQAEGGRNGAARVWSASVCLNRVGSASGPHPLPFRPGGRGGTGVLPPDHQDIRTLDCSPRLCQFPAMSGTCVPTHTLADRHLCLASPHAHPAELAHTPAAQRCGRSLRGRTQGDGNFCTIPVQLQGRPHFTSAGGGVHPRNATLKSSSTK
eukprot:gene25514-biopygen15039